MNTVAVERVRDTLTITHDSANRSQPISFHVPSGNVTSLVLPEGQITISFCSDTSRELQGFAIEFRSLQPDYLEGSPTEFECTSGSMSVAAVARCDGIIDCHDFSDERGCGECSSGRYRCNGSDICILSEFQCDGWKHCPLSDDEMHCDVSRCPPGSRCGWAPFYFTIPPEPPACLPANNWLPFWINVTDSWRKVYSPTVAKMATILNHYGVPILDLEAGFFYGLDTLDTLELSATGLYHLPVGVFRGLNRLSLLQLSENFVSYLEEDVFQDLTNLGLLRMGTNRLTRLAPEHFNGLRRLTVLTLPGNNISNISPDTFRGMTVLRRLVLAKNTMTSLSPGLLRGIGESLVLLNVNDNPIRVVEPGTFSNLTGLLDLQFLSNTPEPMMLYSEIFHGLSRLEGLVVRDERLCCISPSYATCSNREPPHPLFTCRMTFLQNSTIKVTIWILGISALVGNTVVIVTRMRSKSKRATVTGEVQSVLITNLAISDLLMGVYLILLAIMDLIIGESYFWRGRAEEWRASIPCQVAGFISLVSSETSVFLVTLITFDRFICIMFPFGQRRLGVASSKKAACLVWVVALLLGAIGIILNYFSPDAYSLSDVCVGLPLIRNPTSLLQELDERTFSRYGQFAYATVASSSSSTWIFAIFVFLGLNFLSFVAILICYIAIFIRVRFAHPVTGHKNRSTQEVKMALKMSLIVGTDFCCWMPIIILGILVQAVGVTVTPDIYAWLVVFILPINSSLNPFLYTIIEMLLK